MSDKRLKDKFGRFLTVITCTIVMLLLSGCGIFPAEEAMVEPPLVKPPQVNYTTYKVTAKDIENIGSGYGNVISSKQEKLSFRGAGGRLKGIYVNLGDTVKKGDILAGLETEDLRDQLRQRDIDLKRAKLNYEKLIYSASKIDLEIAELDIENAQIEYQKVERNYKASVITANKDGKVVFINQNLQSGDYVNAFETIVSIDSGLADDLYVLVDNFRSYDLHQGMEVMLTAGDEEFTGVIVGVPIEVPADATENLKNSVFIRMNNPPKDVVKGSRVLYKIVFESSENTPVIPRVALKGTSPNDYVYVLENGIKKERNIEPGIVTSTEAEVKKGLEEGELVIID